MNPIALNTLRKRDSSLKMLLDLQNGQRLIFTNTTGWTQLEHLVYSKSLRLGQRTITFSIVRIDSFCLGSQRLSQGSSLKVLLTIAKRPRISLKRKFGQSLYLTGGTLKVW